MTIADIHHAFVTAPTIAVGDKVWLNRRHVRTTWPSRKLDVKRMGPFKVLEVIGDRKLAYKLELPAPMRVHPMCHKCVVNVSNRHWNLPAGVVESWSRGVAES